MLFFSVEFHALSVRDSDDFLLTFNNLLPKVCSGLCHVRSLKLDNRSVAIVGLHCCGDLQAVIFRLMQKVHRVKMCLTVGCCYHRMTPIEGSTRVLSSCCHKQTRCIRMRQELKNDIEETG
ncbi:unnamed protein product [Soboliphyme baturini]|uniref:Methyltranfer_dom domain-containing protein n=1 Tax=Soboliphyme baturini TaxID=241478 RepID=A0A183IVH9_9BILA|nr:unnamed protein product [Soboliphyme baturini]